MKLFSFQISCCLSVASASHRTNRYLKLICWKVTFFLLFREDSILTRLSATLGSSKYTCICYGQILQPHRAGPRGAGGLGLGDGERERTRGGREQSSGEPGENRGVRALPGPAGIPGGSGIALGSPGEHRGTWALPAPCPALQNPGGLEHLIGLGYLPFPARPRGTPEGSGTARSCRNPGGLGYLPLPARSCRTSGSSSISRSLAGPAGTPGGFGHCPALQDTAGFEHLPLPARPRGTPGV